MDNQDNPLSPLRLRRLLSKVLSTESELDAFCLDYLPEVARRFTDGMDRATKVNLLLMLVPHVELLNRLRSANPEVDEHAAALASSDTPTGSGRGAERMPTVWLSFAAEDRPLLEAFLEHLAVFRNQGVLQLISTEAPASPSPGPSPDAGPQTKPDFHPDIILLMLSRRYLVSGNHHLQRALELYHDPGHGPGHSHASSTSKGHGQLRRPVLLTVLLGPTLWESTPLATLAPPLLECRPVSSYADQDEAWVAVANAVRQAILFPPASHREHKPAVAPPAANKPRSLSDIFVYAGPSKVLFVETAQSRELVQRLRMPTVPDGLVVEGPSGIGKTTAVLRALDELQAQRRYNYVSALDEHDIAELDRQIRDGVPQAGYLIIDDFHLLDWGRKEAIARLVKRLCDRNRRDTKVVMIGINPIGASLVEALPDIRGRYSVIAMQGRQPDEKIDELIALGERAANVEFQRRSRFVDEAEGSFALAQRLCYEATRLTGITESAAESILIEVPAQEVAAQVYHTLEQYYRPRLLAFAAWDERPPPRGAGLYLLWHLAHDEEGSVMVESVRLKYRQHPALDAAFAWLKDGNLVRLFQELPRMRQFLHYRRLTGALSAEDPQLWCYLRHLDWVKFARDSGHSVEGRPGPDGCPVLLFAPPPSSQPALQSDAAQLTGSMPVPASGSGSALAIAAPAPFSLLHLSDLHFSQRDQASSWYSQLAEDLRRELQLTRLDALVLSGDIANRGQESGFIAAEQFLLLLAREFDLKPHQIAIVPGNHDLSWELSREAYVAHVRSAYHGTLREGRDFAENPSSKYIEIRDDEKHQLRFRPFADFYQRVRRQTYPLRHSDQFLIHHFEAAGLLLLGLNSAWQIDHNFKQRSGIDPVALGRALDEIRMTPLFDKSRLKIAVFHHPVGGSDEARLPDSGFLERLAQAGFKLALHGHVHEAGDWAWPYYRSSSGLQLLGAGTFGAADLDRRPSVPLHYQLLETHADHLVVHSRRRNRETGAWEPDHRYRQSPGRPNSDTLVIQI